MDDEPTELFRRSEGELDEAELAFEARLAARLNETLGADSDDYFVPWEDIKLRLDAPPLRLGRARCAAYRWWGMSDQNPSM